MSEKFVRGNDRLRPNTPVTITREQAITLPGGAAAEETLQP